MRVTVVDRKAMDEKYGTTAFKGVERRTVDILDDCPLCGEPRGPAFTQRFHEWGEYYEVDCWENPCGHQDSYKDVLREARKIQDGEI